MTAVGAEFTAVFFDDGMRSALLAFLTRNDLVGIGVVVMLGFLL